MTLISPLTRFEAVFLGVRAGHGRFTPPARRDMPPQGILCGLDEQKRWG